VAKPDTALLITNDDKRRETKPPAAFNDLGDAIDMNQTVHEFIIAFFPIAAVASTSAAFTFTCHFHFRHLRSW
jgi:hypothetical protein